jgi:hypothetical protein
MKEIITETMIEARPETVWRVFTEFYRYPNWSSFISSINGEPRVGNTLDVKMVDGKGKTRDFKPLVLVSEPRKEFRWKGKLGGMGWLFSGEHFFILEKASENRTRFVHGERFTGFLVPVLWRSLNTDTRNGFIEFNKAIKRRVEAVSG